MPSKLDALKVLAACYRVLEADVCFLLRWKSWKLGGILRRPTKKGWKVEFVTCCVDVSRCLGTVFCFFFRSVP